MSPIFVDRYSLNLNGIFPAANACAGVNLGTISAATAANYFFATSNFTNAPSAVKAVTGHGTGGLPAWADNRNERLSRDIDGTFNSEWGNLYQGHSGSGFDTGNCLWMNQALNNSFQFGIGGSNGYVGYNILSYDQCVAVCR